MSDVRYMLDTNIISDLIRHPEGSVQQRIALVGTKAISVSAIVASELRFGYVQRGSRRLETLVESALSRVEILPYDEPAAIHYARVRHALEASGRPIGPNDLFIAAHACSLELILVTDNIREFSRIDDLKVENWLERQAPG
jgi:tRNA(fMet)-specific endonuclease VapC